MTKSRLWFTWLRISAICCLFAISTSAIEIIKPALESLIEADLSGKLDQVLAEALIRADVSADISLFPLARALNHYKESRSTCFITGDDELVMKLLNFKPIMSTAFTHSKAIIATLKSQPKITSMDFLNNKTIGSLVGEPFVETLFDNWPYIRVEQVNKFSQNLAKLRANRIHAILTSTFDVAPFEQMLHWSESTTFSPHAQTIHCHDTTENRIFIRQISTSIDQMKSDGTMKKLMGSLYVEE